MSFVESFHLIWLLSNYFILGGLNSDYCILFTGTQKEGENSTISWFPQFSAPAFTNTSVEVQRLPDTWTYVLGSEKGAGMETDGQRLAQGLGRWRVWRHSKRRVAVSLCSLALASTLQRGLTRRSQMPGPPSDEYEMLPVLPPS